MEALLNYPWPGNRYQVENFCERLVLTASKRLLDEKMVLGVLTELFEKAERKQDLQTANTKEAAQTESWKDEQEELLVKTLKKYGGNRKKTAQELGISKSTLWRWMKKYSLFDENII